MSVGELLCRCARDALSTLGEPTVQSLLWHMGNAGVKMAPGEFDIKRFYSALYDMTGGGADIIMEIIARRMADELGMQMNTSATGLEKVLEVLKAASALN
ncbi:hypothetical protein [Candidatus Nitrososphaera sp. FF02]|uniref:hypothetical protein n=1 Tax=Candidatus Nitrososphaera sp. FF02 TaxID=3398226 RepID=UPI0039E9C646